MKFPTVSLEAVLSKTDPQSIPSTIFVTGFGFLIILSLPAALAAGLVLLSSRILTFIVIVAAVFNLVNVVTRFGPR